MTRSDKYVQECLALYIRGYLEDRPRLGDDEWDGIGEPDSQFLFDLGAFIASYRNPKTSASVREWEEPLQYHGLCLLIERDAEEEYDDIQGFLDILSDERVVAAIIKHRRPMDGRAVASWIMKHVDDEGNLK